MTPDGTRAPDVLNENGASRTMTDDRHAPRDAPACRCREPGRSTLPSVLRAYTAPACGRCGSHTVTLMPAVYIACFLSDNTAPGLMVRVTCRACGLRPPGRAPDMHEEGCALLQLHAPVPETMLPAPAPDPLHIRRASGAMAAG